MVRPGSLSKFAAAAACVGMLAGTAASAATPISAPAVDPLVAISFFGSQASQSAICAAGAQSAAAAGAAVAAQAAQQGCVLPVVDAAPPPMVADTAPPPEVLPVAPVTGAGIGVMPLLLGLAAIIGAAALIFQGEEDDGEITLPISPS